MGEKDIPVDRKWLYNSQLYVDVDFMITIVSMNNIIFRHYTLWILTWIGLLKADCFPLVACDGMQAEYLI